MYSGQRNPRYASGHYIICVMYHTILLIKFYFILVLENLECKEQIFAFSKYCAYHNIRPKIDSVDWNGLTKYSNINKAL